MGIETAILGGSLISGVLGSRAAKKAGKASQAGYDAATAEQRRQYDTTRADYAPYRQAGQNALNQLADPNANFQQSPSYDFVREQGLQGLENRFSVGGGGGNAMKALNEFNSGLASQEYGNWWNRQAGMANLGMGGTQGTAQAGANSANAISNMSMQNAGNQANAIYNRYSGINNAVQSGLGNYLYAKQRGLLDKGPFDANQGTPNEFEWPR